MNIKKWKATQIKLGRIYGAVGDEEFRAALNMPMIVVDKKIVELERKMR